MKTIDTMGRQTPGALLRDDATRIVVHDHLRGFGGAHGGLLLARMTAVMAAHPGIGELGGVAGRFLRGVHDDATIHSHIIRRGARTTFARAEVVGGPDIGDPATLVEGTATFGRPSEAPAHSPAPPDAPRPTDCPVFTIPPEFVPLSVHTEIRPIGEARPYTGGDRPELLAWIRLVEDNRPPDILRLIVLADSLAPAHAAVLAVPTAIPTVELSVRPGPALERSRSPWVLLHARTRSATGGWIDEVIDLFDPDGGHLASATQLRLVR